MRRPGWRILLLIAGLLNLALVHYGSWWIEPWREQVGFGSRQYRPFSIRGTGIYGEDGFVLLAWRWGLHRPWEYPPQPIPQRRLGGNPIAMPSSSWVSFGLTSEPPTLKWRADLSRIHELHQQARMGHGFGRAGVIAAIQPEWTVAGRYRNIGIAVHGGWLAAAAAIPFVIAQARMLAARQRHTAGHCPACGYDLRATPDRCPECGHVVDSEPEQRG